MSATEAIDQSHNQDAVYAFFVQLDTADVNQNVSYTMAPASSFQNGWAAATFVDNYSPTGAWINGDGSTWAQFAGSPDDLGGNTNTAVISDAVHNGTNIFIGQTYSDGGAAPVSWGTTLGTITTIIDPAAIFEFAVTTTAPTFIPKFTVDAEVIPDHLSSQNLWVAGKGEEVSGITVFGTPVGASVPEPGLFALWAIGFGLFGLHKSLKRKTTRIPRC